MDTLQIAEPVASFLIDIAAKATVLLMLAILVTWALRRSSAAIRHAVWSLTMFLLLLLPVASCVLPSLAIPILPSVEPQVASVDFVTELDRMEPLPLASEPSNSPTAPTPLTPAASSVVVTNRVSEKEVFANEPTGRAIVPTVQPVERILESELSTIEIPKALTADLSAILISIVWAMGVVFFATFVVCCVLKAVVLRRQSEVVTTGVWNRLLTELTQRLRIRRAVELREHPEPVVPLTLGVFRSVVLLPQIGREWPESMKRTVLLHELAHVRRRDVACQLLGRGACTLFWFHPLAWYALRRLRQEGEQACDDAVVRSGEKASHYADQLLQVAQFCCGPRGLSPGLSMAEGSSLEVRVKSLFDTTRSHEPVRKSAFLILLLLGTITLTCISTVRPVAGTLVAADSSLDPGAVFSDEPEVVDSLGHNSTEQNSEEATRKLQEKNERQNGNASRRPQLAVPAEWKADALDRIVKLCPEFGPEHGGLTLGIARTTGQTVFRMGDRIPIELFVMNVGSRERTFQFRCAPRVSYAPRVVDAKGQVVRGISGTMVFQHPYSVDLNPGEACSIPVGGLGIGDQGASNFEAPTAGRYEMSYRIGTLKSATMRFKVGTDNEGSFRLDVLDDRWGLRQGSAERLSILKPVFGKPKRGIEMGLAFAGRRKKYSTGDKIPIDLFFRNIGDRNVKFQFTADFNWSPPTVVNEQGERVHIPPLPVWLFEGPRTVSLEPGQAFGVKTPGLGLSKGNSVLSLVGPTAGKYRIGLLRTIYDYVSPMAELPDQGHEWQEHLITGSLEIEVGDEQDGTQTAKLLPGKTESLDALKEDVTRIMARSDGPPELPVGAPPSGPVTEDPTPSGAKPASPPEPSLDEQTTKVPLKDVIWWKTVDGLQAGFLLDSPRTPNQRIPNNSVAKYRILVRNTVDKRRRFIVRLLPHHRADAPFLISSDDITESLAAKNLPEKFRAKIVPPRFKHPEPAYVISLLPGEAVFVPNQGGLDELSLFVGKADGATHPTVSKFNPGMNWIVQPLQIQLFPRGGLTNGTSLMGRYKVTRISADGRTRKEPASRIVAVEGGTILKPRIQLDVGTLTAAAERNAKAAKWGEVDKGLQCGIRLLNPEPSYVRGDMLEAELLWRNVSDAAIWSPIPRRLDLYPMVHNSEGRSVPIDFGARFNIFPVSLEVKPLEVRSLGIFKIRLVKEGTPSPKSNAEPAHLTLQSGTYRLSGFGGVSAPDGGNPKSGEIEFKVTSR